MFTQYIYMSTAYAVKYRKTVCRLSDQLSHGHTHHLCCGMQLHCSSLFHTGIFHCLSLALPVKSQCCCVCCLCSQQVSVFQMLQILLSVIVIFFNRSFTLSVSVVLTSHRFLCVLCNEDEKSSPSLDGYNPLNVFKWMSNHMYHSLPLSTGRMQADHGPPEVQLAVGLSR